MSAGEAAREIEGSWLETVDTGGARWCVLLV